MVLEDRDGSPRPPTGEGRAEHYPLTQYGNPQASKDAFLDAYFGDAGYDRAKAAIQAGLPAELVGAWYSDPDSGILEGIEARLQATHQDRQDLQTILLDQSRFIMEGNIADVFEENEHGNLVVKNIKSLPRHIAACIKQMDVIRATQPGPNGRPEYVEALRVVMHDKTKVMNIIGDYTDVKNTALKSTNSGAPKITGMALLTAAPTTKKEIADDGDSRQILDEQEAEGDPAGDRDRG